MLPMLGLGYVTHAKVRVFCENNNLKLYSSVYLEIQSVQRLLKCSIDKIIIIIMMVI